MKIILSKKGFDSSYGGVASHYPEFTQIRMHKDATDFGVDIFTSPTNAVLIEIRLRLGCKLFLLTPVFL
ncbi:MAG: hypothetical protein RBS16_06775 [Candidatus Cloacimonadales bacterium]|jgi:hypothetical protein|nr:hypothetical protein [Candidatus Cloacimonadales bacterium]